MRADDVAVEMVDDEPAPLEECARRDPKGLYAKAFSGELLEFTGVSAPYEAPLQPELRLDTVGSTPGECAELVLERLVAFELLAAEVAR